MANNLIFPVVTRAQFQAAKSLVGKQFATEVPDGDHFSLSKGSDTIHVDYEETAGTSAGTLTITVVHHAMLHFPGAILSRVKSWIDQSLAAANPEDPGKSSESNSTATATPTALLTALPTATPVEVATKKE